MEKNPLEPFFLEFQKNELHDYYFYKIAARSMKSGIVKSTFEMIADDEFKHYDFWKSLTHKELSPDYYRVLFYTFIIKFFGVKRIIRKFEKGEKRTLLEYTAMLLNQPESQWIIEDELVHEKELQRLIINYSNN